MKIIGQVKRGVLIAEIGEDELANIMGFHSAYGDGYKEAIKKAGAVARYGEPYDLVGMSVSVAGFHKRVYEVRFSESKVQESIKTLRNLADALEVAWPSLISSQESEE